MVDLKSREQVALTRWRAAVSKGKDVKRSIDQRGALHMLRTERGQGCPKETAGD